MKTAADLKMEFKRETGCYADTNSWAYLDWLQEKALKLEKEKAVKELISYPRESSWTGTVVPPNES